MRTLVTIFLHSLQKIDNHRCVFVIAVPMILSNLTVPLLGLVDTAVMGHLDKSWYLGGVALGNSIIMVLYFLLGFLRMSTTGLTAQAFGAKNPSSQAKVITQGLTISFALSILLLMIHSPLLKILFYFSEASARVKHYADEYYSIRIYGAPAALANMVIVGWLLGNQKAKQAMGLIIFTNVTNIILDLVLVLGFGYGVKGVAAASTLADYSALGLGGLFIKRQWKLLGFPNPLSFLTGHFHDLGRFMKLNRDVFLRSLCLQMVFAFMTFQGGNLGDHIIAANAILIGFLMFISYGMDGFAYAIEALVGEAIGAKNQQKFIDVLIVVAFWALLIAGLLTAVFAVFGETLIGFISSIKSIQKTATLYMTWLIAFPLVAMWCFLLDGVFVGGTRAKEMRNSMFISSCLFFLVWHCLKDWGNHALWAAMLGFMGARNLTLGVAFFKTKWFE